MEEFGVLLTWDSPEGNNYFVVDGVYLVDEGGDYLLTE